MHCELQRRRRAQCALAATLFAGVMAAGMLYRFPPGQYGFYPRCPVYVWTGLLCPGCGMTRALAALVHGQLREAIRWNALVAVAVPMAAVWGGVASMRAMRGRLAPRATQRSVAWALVAVTLFTVARNWR